jgi:ankyrin repeat protein
MSSASSISRLAAPAPAAAKAEAKKSISLSDLQKRTAAAAQLEKIFTGIKPGQKLANAEVYLDKLKRLESQALQDYQKLFDPKITVTEPVKKARAALERQVAALGKAIAAARSVIPAEQKGQFPWSGQLRDEKDTPLHWAVRKQDYQTALFFRGQLRLRRLEALCQHFAKTVKNKEVTAILKKPGLAAKLIPALEKLHILSYKTHDAQALLKICKDAEVVKVVQDPDFRKILEDVSAQAVFNGLDIMWDGDSRGLTPLDEALLQEDSKMKKVLLFPHLVMNPVLKKLFWGRINEIRGRIAEARQVDVDSLPDACRAAYLGDTDQLMTESDLNAKDENGLTPLHYAILGRQEEAVSFLVSRCDIYTLTKQGHSYFDYALLSGHPGMVNLFERLNIPFRLGAERERFSYLLAAGIADWELSAIARSRDPIGMGGKDQDLAGVNLNLLWAGTALLNRAFFGVNPLPPAFNPSNLAWPPFISTTFEGIFHAFNHHGTGAAQVFKLLPRWALTPAAVTYDLARTVGIWYSTVFLISTQAAAVAGYNLPQYLEAKWGLGPTLKAFGVAGQVFSVIRLCAAIKPVFDRLPAYYEAYATRPKQVRKALAWDAFNIVTQGLMTYGAFA